MMKMKWAGSESRGGMLAAAVTGGVLLFVAACGGGGGTTTGGSADVAQGHELFKKTCATCHGPNGEGMPRLGKNLNANEFVNSNSDADLVAFLKQGRPATHPDNTRGVDMPPKGGNPALSDADLGLIVAYMRSLR